MAEKFTMNEKLTKLRTIGNRLAVALAVLVAIAVPGAIYTHLHPGGIITSAPMAAFTVGVIGGFVGLQRRLRTMSDDDLTLLANSWVYVCLSPLVGGILAIVTYVLFVSGLLAGDLFPKFVADSSPLVGARPESVGNTSTAISESANGFALIFAIHGATPADYGKMLFWCFVAGFSERFATDIMSRFESRVTRHDNTTT